MTRSNLLKLLMTIGIVTLVGGLGIQIHALAASSNLIVKSAQASQLAPLAEATTPTKCMECHHSELLSRVVQLTTDSSPDLRPAWSADGTRLAFYSGRSGQDDIWAINTDGSDEAQLTDDPSRDRRPAWSPDGSKIVFDSDRAGSQDIWIMNADGSNQKQLTTNPGSEMFASFNPAGSQIIFYGYEGGRNDIWTMDTEGGNLRSLTSSLADETKNQCTFACHTPAFSPDGKSIAFHADQNGSRNIWVMDADGNNPRQLTTTSTNTDINNYLPAWSSDGRIIFQAEKPVALTIRTDIRMINPDGSDEITLFAEVAHGGPFIWSPDGTQVALHSQRGGAGNFDIFVATFGEVAEKEEPVIKEATPDEVAAPGKVAASDEVADPEEVESSSAAALSTSVTTPLNNVGIIAIVGVAIAFVLAVVVYSVKKLNQN